MFACFYVINKKKWKTFESITAFIKATQIKRNESHSQSLTKIELFILTVKSLTKLLDLGEITITLDIFVNLFALHQSLSLVTSSFNLS